MCDLEGTSKEHVPPLCLFPEPKDVKGLNFRNNLITVPSCEKHNAKKSNDDEFLLVAIAGIVGNNQLGYMQTITKVNRALRRKSSDFLGKSIMKNIKSGTKNINGYEFPVLFGNPDHERFLNCFEHIVYGLYFHEHQKRFAGEVSLLLGFIEHTQKDSQTFLEFCRKRFEMEDLRLEEKGQNPDVFKYQFCEPDVDGLIGFKLTFYGGTEVFGALIPEGKKPSYTLQDQILSMGLPIQYTLGDEKFQFNQNPDSNDNLHPLKKINK